MRRGLPSRAPGERARAGERWVGTAVRGRLYYILLVPAFLGGVCKTVTLNPLSRGGGRCLCFRSCSCSCSRWCGFRHRLPRVGHTPAKPALAWFSRLFAHSYFFRCLVYDFVFLFSFCLFFFSIFFVCFCLFLFVFFCFCACLFFLLLLLLLLLFLLLFFSLFFFYTCLFFAIAFDASTTAAPRTNWKRL